MMTEAEFKLHMSVYLDGQMRPLRNEIKFLEKRLNKLEALVKGDISPAFPYTNKVPSTTLSESTENSDATNCNSENPTNIDLTEEYLKPIHENVLIIKNFIDEYRMTAEDRYIQRLQSQTH